MRNSVKLTSVFIGWRSSGSQYVPLGHMLTFKVAYQIVTGLAYLHRKNIIFCDLKSDNILVWSLELEESVNVKLSDYGISRQSFHEGAGVEGTPGYQAPRSGPASSMMRRFVPIPWVWLAAPAALVWQQRSQSQFKLNSDSEDTCFLRIQSLNSRYDHITLVSHWYQKVLFIWLYAKYW